MAGYIGSKSSGIISGIDASIAELNLNDKASANGTTEANKVLTADANKDVTAIRNLTATGDVAAGGAITATGTVTRALTRGSIDVGNSSGVSSALAKGAAGTVLTSDGTDLSFVAASGGGEQTFTASGSISAGALVGLKSTGAIATMGATSGVAVQLNPTNMTGATSVTYRGLTYDTTNNKTVQFFEDQQNSQYLSCRVGTVSGSSISYGTTVALSKVVLNYLDATYDSNAQRAVCVFENTSDYNHIFVVVVSISGTTPTFGTPVEVYAGVGEALSCVFDSSNNKVVVAYKKSTSDGRKVAAKVGTVSGTSISFGSESIPSVSGSLDDTCSSAGVALAFDSNSNKVVMQWIGYAYYHMYAAVGTVSGTSISFGTVVPLESGVDVNTRSLSIAFDSNVNKFFHSYSKSGYIRCVVGTVSGTNISFGTPKNLALYGGQTKHDSVFDTSSNQIVLIFNNVTSNHGAILTGPISGTTILMGEVLPVIEVPTIPGNIIFDPDTNQCITQYNDYSGYNLFTTIINASNPLWVGVAAESISDGASGKVTVIGGINTNQSGLVTGAVYGLPLTASTLTAGGDKALGVALSSSSLYINTGKR